MSKPVTVERHAGIILDDLRHFVTMARNRARTKRGGEDIDMEGVTIINAVQGLFWRLGIKPKRFTDVTCEA